MKNDAFQKINPGTGKLKIYTKFKMYTKNWKNIYMKNVAFKKLNQKIFIRNKEKKTAKLWCNNNSSFLEWMLGNLRDKEKSGNNRHFVLQNAANFKFGVRKQQMSFKETETKRTQIHNPKEAAGHIMRKKRLENLTLTGHINGRQEATFWKYLKAIPRVGRRLVSETRLFEGLWWLF